MLKNALILVLLIAIALTASGCMTILAQGPRYYGRRATQEPELGPVSPGEARLMQLIVIHCILAFLILFFVPYP